MNHGSSWVSILLLLAFNNGLFTGGMGKFRRGLPSGARKGVKEAWAENVRDL